MVEKYYGVKDNTQAFFANTVADTDDVIELLDGSVFADIDLPCIATLQDLDSPGISERVIIRDVDFVGTDSITVDRGYGGDTPLNYTSNGAVTVRVMAQHIQDLYDNSVMQIQETMYTEKTLNGFNQVSNVSIYEDSSKTQLLVSCNFTYADAVAEQPATATRTIYKDDGLVFRTENTSFTYSGSELTEVERTVS